MPALRAIGYARDHRAKWLAQLGYFIRFPSVSAQPKHAHDVERCAHWFAAHLRSIGLKNARVISTMSHPVVYASWCGAPGRPTLLIYGHYDVQPVDPVSEWRSPPFLPTVRGDELYGRGASDDKGQLFMHIKAIEACLKAEGALPVNVKCLIEGEEEIGSPNLPGFVWRNRAALAADAVVMSDTQMLGKDRPALCCATRGALYLELEVQGPSQDLHSGRFGGAIYNPIQALAEIIARLHGRDGRIAVPGFYDRVRDWSAAERASMRRNAPSDEEILKNAKAARGWGELGYSLHERITLQPALTINGVAGGYQGAGTKGVIPRNAVAKISFRLVPDQSPGEIDELFRRYIARITPPSVQSIVRTLSGAEPVLINPHHPAMQAAAFAYQKAFGVAPALTRSGGTIPILRTFQKALNAPTVLMGFGLADDRIHGPNEKFHIQNFYRGIETSLWFLHKLSGMKKAHPKACGAKRASRVGAVSDGAAA